MGLVMESSQLHFRQTSRYNITLQVISMELNTEKLEESILTLADLERIDVCDQPVNMRFASQVRKLIRCGEDLFPSIYGLDHVKRRIIEVLMTGNGVLLKGELGFGKTELGKALFSILSDYYLDHPVYAPAGCPVRENALYLYHYLVRQDSGSLKGVCPVCRNTYLADEIDPSQISIERVYLEEGRGFARIQGNEDIEPERILGMYHLSRYAEIGDPFDPRVLEPGKIAQGAQGILFVDELGLLNKEAQYAFIQGLQEKHFSPTNSRMTFPLDFLFIATTNTINEFQIHRTIQNRLVSVRIDRVSFENEVAIVKKELAHQGMDVIFPELYIHFLVETVRKLNNVSVYLGPRSSIRTARIALSSALMEGRAIVNYCDVKEGLSTEILGQADDESYGETREMLEKDFPSISAFLKERLPTVATAASYLSISDDIEYILDVIDDEVIQGISAALNEGERKRDIMNSYLEGFLRGCREDDH